MKLWIISGLALIAVLVLVMPACACEFPDKPLTQGYWKNHPGDWPYLDEWDYDNFFLSGDCYLGVLKNPTKGNAYYILAHQFIAARLNGAPWTSSDSVNTAWKEEALPLFCTYTPKQVAAMKGNDPVRQEFISLAELFDKYNNGYYS
ncbi:MAG: hypothetical protein QCH35_10665 [Methanomicrobiaceae archaeon]|nr:hypothetical protein [Methanomicrobiaceae archaeon]